MLMIIRGDGDSSLLLGMIDAGTEVVKWGWELGLHWSRTRSPSFAPGSRGGSVTVPESKPASDTHELVITYGKNIFQGDLGKCVP
jgi:hypothetical protein